MILLTCKQAIRNDVLGCKVSFKIGGGQLRGGEGKTREEERSLSVRPREA